MRRHELDPVSLTFGFAFTALGLLFLIGQADRALRLHWVWPLLLLVLGAGILLDVARHRPTPALTAEPTPFDQEPEDTTADLDADRGAVDNREPPA